MAATKDWAVGWYALTDADSDPDTEDGWTLALSPCDTKKQAEELLDELQKLHAGNDQARDFAIYSAPTRKWSVDN